MDSTAFRQPRPALALVPRGGMPGAGPTPAGQSLAFVLCGVPRGVLGGPAPPRSPLRPLGTISAGGFFALVHEVGHGLYDQGLQAEHYGTPMGDAVSLGIHESQSRLWENYVGRSLGFWRHFYPLLQSEFPDALHDISLDKFRRSVNRVSPGLIRVQADELTYNLHIMIRFELERALLSGDLPALDLPGAWDELYEQRLGISVAGAQSHRLAKLAGCVGRVAVAIQRRRQVVAVIGVIGVGLHRLLQILHRTGLPAPSLHYTQIVVHLGKR